MMWKKFQFLLTKGIRDEQDRLIKSEPLGLDRDNLFWAVPGHADPVPSSDFWNWYSVSLISSSKMGIKPTIYIFSIFFLIS